MISVAPQTTPPRAPADRSSLVASTLHITADISLNISDPRFVLGNRTTAGMVCAVIFQLPPCLGQVSFIGAKICSMAPSMILVGVMPIVASHCRRCRYEKRCGKKTTRQQRFSFTFHTDSPFLKFTQKFYAPVTAVRNGDATLTNPLISSRSHPRNCDNHVKMKRPETKITAWGIHSNLFCLTVGTLLSQQWAKPTFNIWRPGEKL
jgi:hypothetical protein